MIAGGVMMAYFHKTLKYHKDTTEKRDISNDDIQFLMKLQHKMNTQDTTGTADPRFWVIKGSENVRNDEEPDEFGLYVDGDCVSESTEETVRYLNESILPDCDKCGTNCKIVRDDFPVCQLDFKLTYTDFDGEEDYEYMSMDEVNEFIRDNGYDDVEVFGIEIKPIIYPSTMFLTEKAAREHLENNHYHYSDDAHTYCMCAWRSPEVEKLWKILREVKWDGLTGSD